MKKSITVIAFLATGFFALESCNNQEEANQTTTAEQIPAAESSTTNYQRIGKGLALKTKESLENSLSRAIASKGFDGAVEFCNTKAIPITDSVSKSLNASIKRVSDQPRNSGNQAKEGELFYIDMCKQSLEEGKELKPFISEDDKKMIGYYPIITNSLCLNCHGTKDDIKTETLAKINRLYPNDQATGYKEKELRGIFVVKMDK